MEVDKMSYLHKHKLGGECFYRGSDIIKLIEWSKFTSP